MAINPNEPTALNNLGTALRALGRFGDALDAYNKALSIKPDHAKAIYNKGLALSDLRRFEEAIEALEKFLSIEPDHAEATYNIGRALSELGRFEGAMEVLEKALSIEPDFPAALNQLGLIHQTFGRMDEARAFFSSALSIKPDLVEAHYNRSQIRKFTERDADLEAMEKLYASPDMRERDQEGLAFGLGKGYEDLGEYGKAFDFFAEANKIRRSGYDYSIDDEVLNFQRVMKVFDRSLFSAHENAGSDDKTPIFVLGMPRSGTSLVEQILSSHPQVRGAGESSLFSESVQSFKRDRSANLGIGDWSDEAFAELGDRYIHAIRDLFPDGKHIVNKMPQNFFHIGLIKLALPGAKVIHCKRNPIDTCLSIFKTRFSVGHPYSCDLTELGLYYSLYQEMMGHWDHVLPGFVYNMQYEDIVAEQIGQTRALLNFCGLEWDDACVAFHKTARPVQTASVAQVRRPIYSDSVQAWKRYKNQLAPLLRVLGCAQG